MGSRYTHNSAAIAAAIALAALALAAVLAVAPAGSPLTVSAAQARIVSGQSADTGDARGGGQDGGSIVDAANNLKRVGLAVAGSILALILAFVGIHLLMRRDYGEAVGVFVLGGVIGLFCWAPDAGRALIENTVLRITS